MHISRPYDPCFNLPASKFTNKLLLFYILRNINKSLQIPANKPITMVVSFLLVIFLMFALAIFSVAAALNPLGKTEYILSVIIEFYRLVFSGVGFHRVTHPALKLNV